jgi:hypothetical protein
VCEGGVAGSRGARLPPSAGGAVSGPRCAVLCYAVLSCAVLCSAVVLCCAVLCCAVLCCAVLCCAVLCCAVRMQEQA